MSAESPLLASLLNGPPRRAWPRKKCSRWIVQMLDDGELPPGALRAGIALAFRHIDGLTGVAIVTEHDLAAELKVPVQGLKRSLSCLASAGHAEVERRRGEPLRITPLLKPRSYYRLDQKVRRKKAKPTAEEKRAAWAATQAEARRLLAEERAPTK
jgi:hypothetical protein